MNSSTTNALISCLSPKASSLTTSPATRSCFGDLRALIMHESHISKCSIHPGSDKMYRYLKQLYQLTNMEAGIVTYVRALATMAQTKVKRLLAHSSIGHVGYIRTGFSCGTIEGIQSLLIADLGALAKTNPISAITFSITMFSYAGIPPLAGFCSKFYLFFAALGCGAYFLAPVVVVTSVIGRWAAGRLPRRCENRAQKEKERKETTGEGLTQHQPNRASQQAQAKSWVNLHAIFTNKGKLALIEVGAAKAYKLA
nr:NADH-ubiquinone oxidoreductase chain 2 [Tanacetum cinerariifolium]